jgi:hypothetical protein
MAIYMWPNPASPSGKSILIRAAFGGGIAIDEKCCCVESNCDCENLGESINGQITGFGYPSDAFVLNRVTAVPDVPEDCAAGIALPGMSAAYYVAYDVDFPDSPVTTLCMVVVYCTRVSASEVQWGAYAWSLDHVYWQWLYSGGCEATLPMSGWDLDNNFFLELTA